MKYVELLAPARNLETAKVAILAGADALYCGGKKFSARAYADNFTHEDMIEIIEYAHLFNVKVYMTLNTLLKEDEIGEVFDYVKPLYEAGLDAIIVQDLGVAKVLYHHFPDIELHASTQMSITRAETCQFLKEMGFTRVVPARELTLPEVKTLVREGGLEIETFVHGAMCYAYSGRCFFSSLLGGRSGNRGRCAQSCRLPYMANNQFGYFLSMKDMSTLDILPDLIEAGIHSFKIEGRMKSKEYIYQTVSTYRRHIDAYLDTQKRNKVNLVDDKKKLMDLFNRGGFITGYYQMTKGPSMISLNKPNNQGLEIGYIEGINKKSIRICLHQLLHIEDLLEVKSKNLEYHLFSVDQNYQEGQIIHCQLLPELRKVQFEVGEKVYRVKNQRFQEEISKLAEATKKISVDINLDFTSEGIFATFSTADSQIQHQFEAAWLAQSRPLVREDVLKQMKKLKDTDFELRKLEVSFDKDYFLPVSRLNEIRRVGIEQLKNHLLKRPKRTIVEEKLFPLEKFEKNQPAILVKVSNLEQLQVALDYEYIDQLILDYSLVEEKHLVLEQLSQELLISLPQRIKPSRWGKIQEFFKMPPLQVVGVIIHSLDQWALLKEIDYSGRVIIDEQMGSLNTQAIEYLHSLNLETTVSYEHNYKEMKGLKKSEHIMVYGHQLLMVTENCLRKTTIGCDYTPSWTDMIDRKKANFQVRNECSDCLNMIYNSVPLYLLDKLSQLQSIHPLSFQLHFTIENPREVEVILGDMEKALSGQPLNLDKLRMTRGHFQRGIL